MKEALLMKEIVRIVKEYAPLGRIEEIEVMLPQDLGIDGKRLKKLFAAIGIKLKAKEGKKLKVVALRERA